MTTAPTTMRWDEPEGADARGTVILLAGRGETTRTYARFGRRFSAEAYRVRAVGDVSVNPLRSELLVRRLISDSEVGPVVLVGCDAGAILALRLAADDNSGVSAVITAGLPTDRDQVLAGGGQQAARSADPFYRELIRDPGVLDSRALARSLPAELYLVKPGMVRIEVLAFHGSDDEVTPVTDAVAYYAGLASARVAVVRGGRHDVLNDVDHRTVAATIVLFLERVRNAGVPSIAYAGAAT